MTSADATRPPNRRAMSAARRIVSRATRPVAALAWVRGRKLRGRRPRRTNTMPSATAARTAAAPPKRSKLQTEGFWRAPWTFALCWVARLGSTPVSAGCRRAQTRYEVPCDRSQRANSARLAKVWLSHTIPRVGLFDPGPTRTRVSKVAIPSTMIAGRISAAAKSFTHPQVSHRGARVPRRE
jgi:hypothetical protein